MNPTPLQDVAGELPAVRVWSVNATSGGPAATAAAPLTAAETTTAIDNSGLGGASIAASSRTGNRGQQLLSLLEIIGTLAATSTDQSIRGDLARIIAELSNTRAIANAGSSNVVVEDWYTAISAGTGYAIGDSISNVRLLDGATGTLVSSIWYNVTQGAPIATPPAIANIKGLNDKIEEMLTSIEAKIPTLGVKISSGSISTALASDDAQIGVDGTAIAQPSGGSGIRGWLSGSYKTLLGFLTNTTAPFARLTDGATNATIKPASTAPLASDPALVVVVSPNQAIENRVSSNTLIADIASGAITTNTTTVAITPTWGNSYEVNIPVTTVSGTAPTLDIQIQESDDAGTNWLTVYTFAQITAVGSYRSPKIPLTGNRIRYVQVVGGTTPSFTRSINRLQSNDTVTLFRGVGLIQNATITTGGSSQVQRQQNDVRKSIEIQNNSTADIWVKFGATAGPNSGFKIAAGQSYNNPAQYCPTGSINLWGGTPGQQFAILEG